MTLRTGSNLIRDHLPRIKWKLANVRDRLHRRWSARKVEAMSSCKLVIVGTLELTSNSGGRRDVSIVRMRLSFSRTSDDDASDWMSACSMPLVCHCPAPVRSETSGSTFVTCISRRSPVLDRRTWNGTLVAINVAWSRRWDLLRARISSSMPMPRDLCHGKGNVYRSSRWLPLACSCRRADSSVHRKPSRTPARRRDVRISCTDRIVRIVRVDWENAEIAFSDRVRWLSTLPYWT